MSSNGNGNGRGIGRRRALSTMALGAAGAAMVPMFGARAADTRPNIVFILADDHRYDALGFMNTHPWLETPNMDRIAREGVHFKNSFVTTSLCSPARASFLTGQYPRCHGVMNNNTPWVDSNVTWLGALHSAGYRAGFVGKWHMPGGGVPDMAGSGKLDRMVSFDYAGGQGVYTDCPLVVDGERVKSDGYITDVLTDYSLEFLDGAKNGRFCLYLSHKAVHAMFKPPKRYKGTLEGADLPELEKIERGLPIGLINGYQRARFDHYVQGYYESLRAVDDSVGAVLGWLDQAGLAENTLVVYAGDNGYYWGEHGLNDKRYAYEEGIRVPHLARCPRFQPEGGVVRDEMVLNVDLMPTILESAGVKTPAAVQGESCLGLIGGRDMPWRDSWMYEYFQDPGFPVPPIKAVRTKDWKLITYPHPKERKRLPDEMYNLANDPGERNNLAGTAARAGKEKELRAELARLEKEIGCGGG